MAALIEDHGIIGDLHTAALVSTDGDIDRLCLPRFDPPSVFASILDDERGGRFGVRCTGATRVKQMYLPDSNVLVTRLLGGQFVGDVVDFMVPHEPGASRRGASRLVRLVRAVRGRVDVDIRRGGGGASFSVAERQVGIAWRPRERFRLEERVARTDPS